jgi:hypothetical protein
VQLRRLLHKLHVLMADCNNRGCNQDTKESRVPQKAIHGAVYEL